MYSLVLMAAVTGSPDVSGADTPVAVVAAAPVSYGCSCSGGVVLSSGYGCGASMASYSCYGRGYGCGATVAMPAYRYGCGAVAASTGCYGSCMGTVASSGCSGAVASYGCTGSCYGSSCHGSMAAAPEKHGFLGIVDRIRARRAASAATASYGCMGASCYGSSCHGMSVASYGCTGAVAYSGGCSGVMVSGGCYGSAAVWGAATPAHTGVISEKVIGEKVITDPKTTTTDPKATTTDPKAMPDPKKTGGNEEGANIKFQLPSNAKLFVDGRQTTGTGTERAFFTPPLPAGQKFYYDVKAELVVDGKTVTEEKRVIVKAGDDLRETFPKLFAAAGNPATVAVK
jgi:uncharacterized protein (TIGR03000 family)